MNNEVYTRKWIPTNERLPKAIDEGDWSDDVLICVEDEEHHRAVRTGFYGYYPDPLDKDMRGWWSVYVRNCKQLTKEDKVVAWMPLPESYKGELG